MGNIMHRGRYQTLIQDEIEDFVMRVVTKLSEIKCVKTAEKLLEKKDVVKQYFRDQNWTTTDFIEEWKTKQDGNQIYGKINNNYLINSKGIKITTSGYLCIAYFNEKSIRVKPYIRCTEKGFVIVE